MEGVVGWEDANTTLFHTLLARWREWLGGDANKTEDKLTTVWNQSGKDCLVRIFDLMLATCTVEAQRKELTW